MQYADAHQVELGPSIHLAFQVLQPVDLALDLAATPGRDERGSYGPQVGFEPGREALQVRHRAGACLGQPAVEPIEVAVAHEAEQPQRQVARCSNGRLDATERFDEAPPV